MIEQMFEYGHAIRAVRAMSTWPQKVTWPTPPGRLQCQRMTPDRHRHRRGLLLTALVHAVVLAPLPPAAAAAADPGIQPRANVKSLLSHQVYGYLPYWRLNSGTAAPLRFDLLCTSDVFR